MDRRPNQVHPARVTTVAAIRPSVESIDVAPNGAFPGSPHAARVYRAVLGAAHATASERAEAFEALFARHGWPPAWRAGLYEVHHYHSSAHEVLGIFSGWVRARLGGPGATIVTLRAGDVVLIPAGVAHCNEGQSADFQAVGAYPRGTKPDMRYGREKERAADAARAAALPAPAPDPVFGSESAPSTP
jgi:uncharacterized protein YjlB